MLRTSRSILLLALLLFCGAIPAFCQKVDLDIGLRAQLVDQKLVDTSAVALGGGLGVGLDDVFTKNLRIGIEAAYAGFLPASATAASVNCVYGMVDIAYRFELGSGLRLGMYLDGGYGLCVAGAPGASASGGQGLAAAGARLDVGLTRGLDMVCKVGVQLLFEQSTVFFEPELQIGVAIGLADGSAPVVQPKPKQPEAPPAVSPETASAKKDLAAIADVKVVGDSGVEGQRIVIHSSFVANDITLTRRFYQQFPAIVRYLKTLPNLVGIDVEGYVADDGTKDDGKALSQARAKMVMSVLQREFKTAKLSFSAVGMGGEYPIADNGTALGRQQNRRIELVLHVAAAGDDAAAGKK